MRNIKGDTGYNFSITFFLILFSLFAFTSSSNHGNNYSSTKNNPGQSALVFGDISSRQNAIPGNALKLSGIQKYYDWALNTTSPHPSPIQHLISDYNHRITQSLIQIQKTELTVKPLFLWRFRNTLHGSATGDLPVIS